MNVLIYQFQHINKNKPEGEELRLFPLAHKFKKRLKRNVSEFYQKPFYSVCFCFHNNWLILT